MEDENVRGAALPASSNHGHSRALRSYGSIPNWSARLCARKSSVVAFVAYGLSNDQEALHSWGAGFGRRLFSGDAPSLQTIRLSGTDEVSSPRTDATPEQILQGRTGALRDTSGFACRPIVRWFFFVVRLQVAPFPRTLSQLPVSLERPQFPDFWARRHSHREFRFDS